VRVVSLHDWAELVSYQAAWDRLADGCVFRSSTWLGTWWRHYGAERRLHVMVALADGADTEPVAILPAYVERSIVRGRVLRLLGDGEVCSDHVGVLKAEGHGVEAARAIASHLAERDDWDLLDFDAIDADDVATMELHMALVDAGCRATVKNGDRCWSIDLPGEWEEFLALQSKSHRKQLRQLERRVLDAGLAQWQLVKSADEFDAVWGVFEDLHQRRRQSLGQPGCFASLRWAAFHRDVARRLLAEGRLRLSMLELEGTAVAAEYHLAGSQATYAYQGGVDPARLAEEPGRLSTICSIKQAIAERHARFELLRGDEPYKAHWRATPTETRRLQAAPPRAWARLRHRTWSEAERIGRFAKQLTGLFS
jgi:CelD/BcsL family acetyltransferase involved in cellulose biosynthesis